MIFYWSDVCLCVLCYLLYVSVPPAVPAAPPPPLAPPPPPTKTAHYQVRNIK